MPYRQLIAPQAHRSSYIDVGETLETEATASDAFTLGRRLRHFRTAAGLTLAQLAGAAGTTTAQLSHIENGRREPRLSLLQQLARAVGVPAAQLIADEPPPDRRAQLEIALEHAQRASLYRELGAPVVRPSRTLPLAVLEIALEHAQRGELARRAREAVATRRPRAAPPPSSG